MKKDIENLQDIQLMVDTFYGKVQQDDLLKDIFNGVIQEEWPRHLEKMYRFWQTVLLKEHTYHGAPFAPHAKLPVNKNHFGRWEQLFCETVDAYFEGEKATEAKWRAGKMAELFLSKIEYYQSKNSTPLL